MNAGHPAPGSPVGSSPVYWKLDEGYGTAANNSGNGGSSLNGSITSGTWTNAGKYNKALTFTASTSVTTTIIDPAYSNTVSLWVYPTTSIASKTLVTATKFITDSSSRPTYGSCVGTALALSTWTHIIAVSNGSGSCAMYQNGNVTATGTTGVTFGTSINIGGLSFIGSIDEFRFFNFPVTADQVKLLYNQSSQAALGALSTDSSGVASNADTDSYCPPGQGSVCTPPVGEWKMDENTGIATTYDTSTGGRNGTLTSIIGSSWVQGKIGAALQLDGSADFVDIGTGPSSVKSISFWVNPITTTEYFINLTSTTDYIWANAGTVTATGLTSPTIYVNGIQSSAITAGSWQHIVVTTATTENASNLDLGRTQDTNYLEGKIDHVRLYDYALTQSQIFWDYNRGKPVGWWKLDENTGTAANDSTGNSTAGTLTNTPTWATGKFNQAVSFAGSNQHVLIGDDPDFDFADDEDMTLTTWFKHSAASAQEIILSKYNEAGYKIIMESDGDITCGLDYDANWTPTDSATSTAATYDDGNWHHITCVKTGATSLSLYIDGVLIATDSSITATNTLTNADPLYLGIDADGLSNDFTGSLDDVRIYRYPLTAQQIKIVMGGGAVRFGQ